MGTKFSQHGPQVVGGHYHNGYWHYNYRVLKIDGDYITIEREDGEIVTHCTSWDWRDDRQVGKPCRRVHCKWGRK
jgi:hypothetical protein